MTALTRRPEPAQPCSGADLLAMTEGLSHLLERETRALAAMRIQDAASLKDEKARLTLRYRAALEELRAGRATLTEIAEPERRQLMAAAMRLADVVKENVGALRAGRAAVERVVAALARAVSSRERSIAGYVRPRHAPARLRPTGGVAVDRRL